MLYDVFLSFKSEDYTLARNVYNFLIGKGIKVFFSKESLPRIGSSEYREAIDNALDSSKHMIVVCSDLSYLDSKWVKHEYTYFSGERIEGRKPGSNIIIITTTELFNKEVKNNNKKRIPHALRQEQIYSIDDFSLEKDLLNYVSPKVPTKPIIIDTEEHLTEKQPEIIIDPDPPVPPKKRSLTLTSLEALKRPIISTAAIALLIILLLLIIVPGIKKAKEKRDGNDLEIIRSSDTDTAEKVDKAKSTFTFGSYPQSRVIDSALLFSLNSQNLNWKSFDYYAGHESFDGSMKSYDIAFYADTTYENNKYRAVRLDEYRPTLTSASRVGKKAGDNTNQYDNGYLVGEVYWFKYEPITWTLVDKKEGLAVTSMIIDAQPYINVLYKGSDERYYNTAGDYANTWETSSLRAWLNNDFYYTAFSSDEMKRIYTSTLKNNYFNGTDYNYNNPDTFDKVFILSYEDWINTDYGFSSSASFTDGTRSATGTDYAKFQNLDVFEIETEEDRKYPQFIGNSYYGIRTMGKSTRNICYTDARGFILNFDYANDTSCGVRPAIRIKVK